MTTPPELFLRAASLFLDKAHRCGHIGFGVAPKLPEGQLPAVFLQGGESTLVFVRVEQRLLHDEFANGAHGGFLLTLRLWTMQG